LYIEEIERLNKSNKGGDLFSSKEKIEELNKKEKEKIILNQIIKTLKQTIKQFEKKMADSLLNEQKMKKEIESLKRQLAFHNDKLQFEMTMKKAEEMKNKTMKMASKPQLTVTSGSFIEKEVSVRTKTNSKDKSTDISKPDLTLSKIISKKRNYSDNNPNMKDTISSLVPQMTKKRYEKKEKDKDSISLAPTKEGIPLTAEYNNISINLNLHLKNSNNTNISVNTSSSKAPAPGNSSKQLDYKSPNRPKGHGYTIKSVYDTKQVNFFHFLKVLYFLFFIYL
jgi:hypothetical protein